MQHQSRFDGAGGEFGIHEPPGTSRPEVAIRVRRRNGLNSQADNLYQPRQRSATPGAVYLDAGNRYNRTTRRLGFDEHTLFENHLDRDETLCGYKIRCRRRSFLVNCPGYRLQWQYLVNTAEFDGFLRHPEDNASRLVLSDGPGACLLHLEHAARTVVAHTG